MAHQNLVASTWPINFEADDNYRILYHGSSSAQELIVRKLFPALELLFREREGQWPRDWFIFENATDRPSVIYPQPDLTIFFHAGQDSLRSSASWIDSAAFRDLGVPVLDIVDTPHYGAISSAFHDPAAEARADSQSKPRPAAVVGLTSFLGMDAVPMSEKIAATVAPYAEAAMDEESRTTHPQTVCKNPWWDADVVCAWPQPEQSQPITPTDKVSVMLSSGPDGHPIPKIGTGALADAKLKILMQTDLQNKKRLSKARQEQDATQRDEGGVVSQTCPMPLSGANGQALPNQGATGGGGALPDHQMQLMVQTQNRKRMMMSQQAQYAAQRIRAGAVSQTPQTSLSGPPGQALRNTGATEETKKLYDNQIQLMILAQQNRERLMQHRQEQAAAQCTQSGCTQPTSPMLPLVRSDHNQPCNFIPGNGNGGAPADYKKELMLLEQRNEKLRRMVRQEKDAASSPTSPMPPATGPDSHPPPNSTPGTTNNSAQPSYATQMLSLSKQNYAQQITARQDEARGLAQHALAGGLPNTSPTGPIHQLPDCYTPAYAPGRENGGALADYQLQLKLLEAQNKIRLFNARQMHEEARRARAEYEVLKAEAQVPVVQPACSAMEDSNEETAPCSVPPPPYETSQSPGTTDPEKGLTATTTLLVSEDSELQQTHKSKTLMSAYVVLAAMVCIGLWVFRIFFDYFLCAVYA